MYGIYDAGLRASVISADMQRKATSSAGELTDACGAVATGRTASVTASSRAGGELPVCSGLKDMKKRKLTAQQLSRIRAKAGRKGGRKGGKVCTQKGLSMASVEKRAEVSSKGAAARWGGQD